MRQNLENVFQKRGKEFGNPVVKRAVKPIQLKGSILQEDMIGLVKTRNKLFLDYKNVEVHLAHMRKKNLGLVTGKSPVQTLMITPNKET